MCPWISANELKGHLYFFLCKMSVQVLSPHLTLDPSFSIYIPQFPSEKKIPTCPAPTLGVHQFHFRFLQIVLFPNQREFYTMSQIYVFKDACFRCWNWVRVGIFQWDALGVSKYKSSECKSFTSVCPLSPSSPSCRHWSLSWFNITKTREVWAALPRLYLYQNCLYHFVISYARLSGLQLCIYAHRCHDHKMSYLLCMNSSILCICCLYMCLWMCICGHAAIHTSVWVCTWRSEVNI